MQRYLPVAASDRATAVAALPTNLEGSPTTGKKRLLVNGSVSVLEFIRSEL
jgi:hypothetical protein